MCVRVSQIDRDAHKVINSGFRTFQRRPVYLFLNLQKDTSDLFRSTFTLLFANSLAYSDLHPTLGTTADKNTVRTLWINTNGKNKHSFVNFQTSLEFIYQC